MITSSLSLNSENATKNEKNHWKPVERVEKFVESETQLSKKTKDQLIQVLKTRLHKDKLIIVFNHFERVTKSVAQFWLSISSNEYIIFFGSLFSDFKKEAYGFYQIFDVVNQEEREALGKEVNVTIPLMLILGVLIIIILYKLSLMSSREFMTAVIMPILIIRSLMFFVGK